MGLQRFLGDILIYSVVDVIDVAVVALQQLQNCLQDVLENLKIAQNGTEADWQKLEVKILISTEGTGGTGGQDGPTTTKISKT